jgi:hypothetical protein
MVIRENGKIYLVKDGLKYMINNPEHGEVLPPRQLAQIAHGDYGQLVKEIYEAQKSEGLPHRFAWRGIVNSLGDFNEVLPPTRPSVA